MTNIASLFTLVETNAVTRIMRVIKNANWCCNMPPAWAWNCCFYRPIRRI